MKKVVVLGAGYAGLKVVHELQKRANGQVEITLVDKNNYHYEATALHEVAAGTLPPSKISYPVADIIKPAVTTFIQDEVTGFDLDDKTVSLKNHDALSYDYLVIALGFVSETFGVEGAEEYALPMANLEQAEAIHTHILKMMDEYNKTQDPDYLKLIVCGAGFTGIELAGVLADGRKEYADRAGVNPSQIKIEVVEASTRLLPMFSEKLANYGVNVVKGLGVELVTGARIQKVEPDKITYTMGKDEEETTGTTTGKTIIWTTGVSGSPIVQADEALKARRGRSIPTDHLTVEGHDDAYIIGDVAAVMPPEGGRPYPTTAQIALGMGKYVAEDLANRIKNGSQLAKPFVYNSLGTVASVGNTRAFGEAMGHEYRGYVASALKKMIANESLYRVGGAGQVLHNGRFDLYH